MNQLNKTPNIALLQDSGYHCTCRGRPLPAVGGHVVDEELVAQVITVLRLGDYHPAKNVDSIEEGPRAGIEKRIRGRSAPRPQSRPAP